MTRAVWALFLMIQVATPALAARPIAELRTAAQAGDADAQYELAEVYRMGRGVTADPEAAIMWYRRAATKGHARASDELGFTLFAHGERREAIPYIEKAAARGDARAFYLLGTSHFNGDYVTKDWPLAYAQTSRAAEAGLPAAKRNLDQMGRYLLAGDRAKADEILSTLPPVRRTSAPAPVSKPVQQAVAAAPSPPPSPTVTKGPWKAQVGAYGSAEGARAGWQTLSARVKRLATLEQRIVPAGKVTRLQAFGLLNRAEAEALCRDVKRAGGDCFTIAP